jgi:hypothetical protein
MVRVRFLVLTLHIRSMQKKNSRTWRRVGNIVNGFALFFRPPARGRLVVAGFQGCAKPQPSSRFNLFSLYHMFFCSSKINQPYVSAITPSYSGACIPALQCSDTAASLFMSLSYFVAAFSDPTPVFRMIRRNKSAPNLVSLLSYSQPSIPDRNRSQTGIQIPNQYSTTQLQQVATLQRMETLSPDLFWVQAPYTSPCQRANSSES